MNQKIKSALFISTLLLSALACKNNVEKDQISQRILDLESNVEYDAAAEDLCVAYTELLDHLTPLDTLWDETMWKRAQAERQLGAYERAVETMTMIWKKSTNMTMKENALFMAGFLADEELNDDLRAKNFYDLFLQNFPNSRQTDQVKTLKSFLGKTNEEILEHIRAQNPQ